MRKVLLIAVVLCMWILPVYAQEADIVTPSECCQFGTTYGATTYAEMPSCSEVADIVAYQDCTKKGGKVVSGTCNSDGVCGGSKTCCGGVSVGETCTTFLNSSTAEPDTCAETTESKCDALSVTGAHATKSYPGGTCEKGTCVQPSPPPPA